MVEGGQGDARGGRRRQVLCAARPQRPFRPVAQGVGCAPRRGRALFAQQIDEEIRDIEARLAAVDAADPTEEPIEVRDAEFGHKPGSREGYRARPGMRLSGYRLADLSPVLRHAIQQKLPAGEKVVEHWVSPLDFEIDLTHLRANLKNPKVSPDAAAGDICLIAEPFFFASEPEVEANGPFLLDDALVATWAGLGDEHRGTPSSSSSGGGGGGGGGGSSWTDYRGR